MIYDMNDPAIRELVGDHRPAEFSAGTVVKIRCIVCHGLWPGVKDADSVWPCPPVRTLRGWKAQRRSGRSSEGIQP